MQARPTASRRGFSLRDRRRQSHAAGADVFRATAPCGWLPARAVEGSMNHVHQAQFVNDEREVGEEGEREQQLAGYRAE